MNVFNRNPPDEDELEEVIDPYTMQGPLDTEMRSGADILPQLDEWGKTTLEQFMYQNKYVQLPDGSIIREREPKYPDLLAAASYVLSHHPMIMHYSWEDAQSTIDKWEGYFFDPLYQKYRRLKNDDGSFNARPRDILLTLNTIFNMKTKGGSLYGSHQGYIEKLVGALRTLVYRRGREE